MKSRLSQRKISLTILTSLLVLFLAAIILVVLEKTKTTDFIKLPKTVETDKTSQYAEEQSKAAAQAKQTFIDESVKTPSEEPSPSPAAQQTNLTITANQDGNTITILTKIQGVASGECALKVQNGTASTSQKAQLIYQPEFSSCAGFSLQKSVLGVGKWDFTVTVTPTSGQAFSQSTSLGVQ